jgi:oligopeptide/dipeptide ABC transporter ATP-binding protein
MRSIPASPEAALAATPVLSVEGLSVRFGSARAPVDAVSDLSFTVAAGECLALVGESGAGKSQAMLAVMGLTPPQAQVSGIVRLGNLQLSGARRRVWNGVRGARIGMIFQDPMSSLAPHLRVGDQIAEAIVAHRGVRWREARERARALLASLHVTDPARRARQYPHELSGGMRQRVMLAMALSCDPTLLIADEPTTALDVTIQAQILALLAELKRTRAMGIVLITHDLGVAAGIADRIAVLQGGRLVELAPVRRLFAAPEHPYTRALLSAVPRLDAASPTARQCAPAASDLAVPQSAALLQLRELTVHFPLRGGWRRPSAVLRALENVSLDLRPGESVGIVGESGSGKSTLARAVLQLVRPTAGEVVWLGCALQSLTAAQLRPLRRDLQIIFQDPLASLDPRMTALEIVAEPLRLHRSELTAPARRAEAATMLARVGLPAQIGGRYPHELSGGQGQRVGIARAMILRPKLLICDEPVSALDVSIQRQIMQLLEQMRRENGTSVLFVSHNLAVVREWCDRVLVLYLGHALEIAPTDTLYARPLHPYTRALLAAVPVPDPEIQPGRLLLALEGEPPSATAPPSGCVFHTRCAYKIALCASVTPPLESPAAEQQVACHRWRELDAAAAAKATAD